jgi:hypothetical protein
MYMATRESSGSLRVRVSMHGQMARRRPIFTMSLRSHKPARKFCRLHDQRSDGPSVRRRHACKTSVDASRHAKRSHDTSRCIYIEMADRKICVLWRPAGAHRAMACAPGGVRTYVDNAGRHVRWGAGHGTCRCEKEVGRVGKQEMAFAVNA